METKVKFDITFGGPALDDGLMDVRDLAPALLSVGDACTRANRVLNGKQAEVHVRVDAGFQRGSFTVILELFQQLAGQPIMDTISDANNIAKFVGYGGGVGGGAIALMRFLKGRRPEKVEKQPDGGVTVTLNNCTINTTEQAFALSQDRQFRGAVQRSLSPLTKEGIEYARIGSEEHRETLTPDDVEFFDEEGGRDEDLLVDSTFETAYEIVVLPLRDGYKWRLSAGETRITATMEDEGFRAKMEAGEVKFGAGDIIRVRIRQRAWRCADGGVRQENAILEVLQHLPKDGNGPPPLSLPDRD